MEERDNPRKGQLTLLRPLQFLPNVATTKFDTKAALKLAENLGVGDSLARLVVLEDGRLLVDLLGEVLL